MSRRWHISFLYFVALCTPVVAQEKAAPSADTVKELQGKFQSERDAALKRGFAEAQLDRADRIAARAGAALANGQTREAAGLFREARWLIPIQPAELPKNVSRIFGYPRLRHGDEVTGVAYSPDGKRLISSSKDGTVKIWDLANGRELITYRQHHEPVRSVAIAPNGKFVVSAAGNEVHVWNPENGKLIRKLTGHTKPVNCVVVRPDSKAIASGSDDETVRIWDADSDKLLLEIDSKEVGSSVMDVAYNAKGDMLGAVTGDGKLFVWDPDKVRSQRKLLGISVHSSGAYQVAFAPDGRFVATCGDRSAKTTKLGTNIGLRRNELTGHTGLVSAVAISTDGKWLATGSADNTIRVWEIGDKDEKLARTFQGHEGQITDLAFSPDGETLASASMDQNVRLWSLRPVDSHRSFEGHTGYVWSAVMRPDGKQIASGGADRTVRLWDAATGKQLHVLTGHSLPVTTVLYSPNSQLVVSCGGDKLLKIWDANSGQFLRDLSGHEAAVMAAAYSRDGSKIISGAADHLVKIWDPNSGKEADTLKGHTAAVSRRGNPPGRQGRGQRRGRRSRFHLGSRQENADRSFHRSFGRSRGARVHARWAAPRHLRLGQARSGLVDPGHRGAGYGV